MKYASLDDTTYALRLERGDDIHVAIQDFCAVQQITNAKVEGIGSAENLILAHYSVDTREFTDKPLEGVYEVVSLLGNISLVDGKPFAHLHTTLSDISMRTYGGHLAKGACSATLELIVVAYSSEYTKTHNDVIGLKVWDF